MRVKPNQVTIYSASEFMGNINRYEGTLIEHGAGPYAQYKNAPFVTFVPKKKRNAVKIRKGYKPFLLILEGTGHPEPPSMFGEAIVTLPVAGEMKESKYSSFDDRWETDFDAMIDKYIAESGTKVIADYRHTKGFNS